MNSAITPGLMAHMIEGFVPLSQVAEWCLYSDEGMCILSPNLRKSCVLCMNHLGQACDGHGGQSSPAKTQNICSTRVITPVCWPPCLTLGLASLSQHNWVLGVIQTRVCCVMVAGSLVCLTRVRKSLMTKSMCNNTPVMINYHPYFEAQLGISNPL